VGLFVQLYKCSAWAPSSLPPRFAPPTKFCCSFGGIKILGIPFDFVSFASLFLQKALSEDVQHANVFPKLGDIQVAFVILFQCFTQKPSFFAYLPSPLPSFLSQLIAFYYTTWGIF
jgi:hypothetical protein